MSVFDGRNSLSVLKKILLFVALAVPTVMSAVEPDAGFDVAPFSGRSMAPQFAIFYEWRGFSPVITPGEWSVTLAQNVSQCFKVHRLYTNNGVPAASDVAMDYENYLSEFRLSYGVCPGFEAGIDLSWLAYSGGVMDAFLEAYHHLFGFPNAWRETAPQNRVFVYVPTENGITLRLDGGVSGLCDVPVFVRFGGPSGADFRTAFTAVLKLPFGRPEILTGSGGADIAAGASGSWRFMSGLFAFADLALNLPLAAVFPSVAFQPNATFQAIAGCRWQALAWLSAMAQFNFKSPSLSSDWVAIASPGFSYRAFAVWQTELVFGVLFHTAAGEYRVSLEEDPFFSNGPDFRFNVEGSWSFLAGGH